MDAIPGQLNQAALMSAALCKDVQLSRDPGSLALPLQGLWNRAVLSFGSAPSQPFLIALMVASRHQLSHEQFECSDHVLFILYPL